MRVLSNSKCNVSVKKLSFKNNGGGKSNTKKTGRQGKLKLWQMPPSDSFATCMHSTGILVMLKRLGAFAIKFFS